MGLTGKAKEDFEYFLYEKYGVLYELKDYHETMINAEVIEWLDSIRIYISTIATNNEFMSYITNNDFSFYEKTRQEAIEKAIEQANLIYNEKLKGAD